MQCLDTLLTKTTDKWYGTVTCLVTSCWINNQETLDSNPVSETWITA